jgi:hypothetical protein
MNFLFETPELAEMLREAWESATGRTYDPWADIASIIGILDGLRSRPPSPRARIAIERTLASAVSTLT